MRHEGPLVRSYAVTHPVGLVHLPTRAGWDQVVYARAGLFLARTDRQRWTVPPHRALCIGDGTRVRIETPRPVSIRCLYLRVELGALDGSVRVVDLAPLARELLLHAVSACPLDLDTPAESALITLLIDRLSSPETAELQLPLPVDPRARQLARLVLEDPTRPLVAAVDRVAASRRTLERLFRAETQMTLAGWQRRARVLAATEMMAAGDSVTAAALAVGYATPSSFVVAFRSELGVSPRAFIRAHG